MKNIIKKLIMLATLIVIVVFVAGCSVNVPAESTTTTVPPTKVTQTTVAQTTTTVPEHVFGPDNVSIKMVTKEMGCDDIGGFYTLWPELTIYGEPKAATITFKMTGGDFPEIHTLELDATGVYHAKNILDYSKSCDVVFQAEVIGFTLH